MSSDSVSDWLEQLKAGDPAAAQQLWQRYFGRLVRLARQKLRGGLRRVADEEDVALSAFDSFCRGAEQGRFPCLADRDDLWRVLVVITSRKAFDLLQQQGRKKRGGGAVRGESVFLRSAGRGEEEAGLGAVVGAEPTPEFAAQVAEECRRLLGTLGDEELRSLALWKMEGYSNEEIADKLGCVPRTVERKLHMIRKLWEKELPA